MAWAEQLSSGLWRGGYRDRNGRKRYTDTVRHKPRALREAGAAEEKARRTGRDLDAGRMLWSEWADQWLPTRRLEASTQRAEASRLRQVRARWDDVRLDEITPMMLRRWVRELERAYSPSSVHKTFYLLASSLKDAQQDGLIETNPCRGIELPPLPPAEERYLTDVEIGKILFRLDGVYRMLAEVLIGTGMRISEACGLHWHRVDLGTGMVSVIETWDIDAGEMKAYPKGKQRRTVPMTPELVKLLVAWRDAHPDAGSCGRLHAKHRAADARRAARGVDPVDRCRSGLVLPGPKGAALDAKNFGKRQWARAVAAAEVEDATPHALRHTYASRLVTAGVSLARVQKLLGHSSIVTTERYGHLIGDGHAEIRAALAAGERGAAGGAAGGSAGSGDVSPWRRPRAL
jgi:integrase